MATILYLGQFCREEGGRKLLAALLGGGILQLLLLLLGLSKRDVGSREEVW